jgi:dihydrofolate reductase
MRKLGAFTIVSLDGYFAGPSGEIDWFRHEDEEDRQFSIEQADPSSTLVFGHTTHEMMRSFWASPFAIKNDPVIAGVMNNAQKIVFSGTMKPVKDGPVWKNVRVIREITPDTIHALKEEPGGDMVILGSGSIVQQLANLGLIDEFGLMVNPIILGTGKPLFQGVRKMEMEHIGTRTFRNGKVFLRYKPV